MNDTEIHEFQKIIRQRHCEAVEASTRGPESLTASEAALVRRLSPNASRLIQKIVRALYVVEPSDANHLQYMINCDAFVSDLAHYSARLERRQVRPEDLLTREELKTIPERFSVNDGAVERVT